MNRVKWDVEELVALICVYDRVLNEQIVDLDSELQSLSIALKRRADILHIPHDSTYRNHTGVKMIYQNLQYVASGETAGLSNASKAMYAVYEMYQKCPVVFKLIAEEFTRNYCQ